MFDKINIKEAIDALYEETGGRWILILLTSDEKKLFLDPYGSLSAIYSEPEHIIVSTLSIVTP